MKMINTWIFSLIGYSNSLLNPDKSHSLTYRPGNYKNDNHAQNLLYDRQFKQILFDKKEGGK